MGRTYTSLTYHLIFSTKYRLKTIRPEFRERLYQYIGGIIREKEGVLLEIGGIEDHIHIMAGIPPTILVSDMLKFIKSNSSGWVNDTIQLTHKFAWQPGYGAFTSAIHKSLRFKVTFRIRNSIIKRKRFRTSSFRSWLPMGSNTTQNSFSSRSIMGEGRMLSIAPPGLWWMGCGSLWLNTTAHAVG